MSSVSPHPVLLGTWFLHLPRHLSPLITCYRLVFSQLVGEESCDSHAKGHVRGLERLTSDSVFYRLAVWAWCTGSSLHIRSGCCHLGLAVVGLGGCWAPSKDFPTSRQPGPWSASYIGEGNKHLLHRVDIHTSQLQECPSWEISVSGRDWNGFRSSEASLVTSLCALHELSHIHPASWVFGTPGDTVRWFGATGSQIRIMPKF